MKLTCSGFYLHFNLLLLLKFSNNLGAHCMGTSVIVIYEFVTFDIKWLLKLHDLFINGTAFAASATRE
jgi:hypothetical protein